MKKLKFILVALLLGGTLQAQGNKPVISDIKLYRGGPQLGVIEVRISGKGAGDVNFVSFQATGDILPGGVATITAGGLYAGGGEQPLPGNGKGGSNGQTKVLQGTFLVIDILKEGPRQFIQLESNGTSPVLVTGVELFMDTYE